MLRESSFLRVRTENPNGRQSGTGFGHPGPSQENMKEINLKKTTIRLKAVADWPGVVTGTQLGLPRLAVETLLFWLC